MINLFRLFSLTIKRKKNDANYLKFQEYQAEYVIKSIINVFELHKSMTIMDYGCGIGGYTKYISQYFDAVIAVDFHVKPINCHNKNIEYVEADLLSYRRDPVDIIFCSSVIEHIDTLNRKVFVKSIADNLKSGGYLYLSFPPFSSPIGGHKCAPFHYFPDKISFYLARVVKKYSISSYEAMWGSWGLYKTSIDEVNELLVVNGFKVLTINSRYMPKWYSKLFGLNNYLNWNAEFYCLKS